MIYKKLYKYLINRRNELHNELHQLDELINEVKPYCEEKLFIRKNVYVKYNDKETDNALIDELKLNLSCKKNDDFLEEFKFLKSKNYIGSHKKDTEIDSVINFDFVSELPTKTMYKIVPKVKKNSTWKKYLIEVIIALEGSAKTNDVANVIINSVKDVSFVQARQIASDLLPELVKDGLLEVEKGNSRKEGNTYLLKNFKSELLNVYE